MKRVCRIEFGGGLGNQLFQYAGLLYLTKVYPNVKFVLDFSPFLIWKSHYGIELQKILNIECPNTVRCIEYFREYLPDRFNYLLLKIRNIQSKLCRYNKVTFDVLAPVSMYLDSLSISNSNLIISAYFQNINIVEPVIEQFRSKLRVYSSIGGQNDILLNKYMNRQTVAVHIRRGDYLKSNQLNVISGVDFYNRAMAFVKEKCDNPVFCIFSDDSKWAHDNLKTAFETIYIDWNIGENSYKDLLLMMRCKHNIIANSTFSWWGAFLNPNKDKIVIAPKRWMVNMDSSIICPQGWVILDN